MSQEISKITGEWSEQAKKLLANNLLLRMYVEIVAISFRTADFGGNLDNSDVTKSLKADVVALKAVADYDFFDTHWSTTGTPETEPQRKFVARVIDEANKLLAPKVA